VRSVHRIIGGVFGLGPPQAAQGGRPRWARKDDIRLASGRSAMTVLVEHLRPRVVWLPAFLCPALVDALLRHGADVRFYEVEVGREEREPDWESILRPGDMVVAIDYFGYLAPVTPARVRAQGCWYVEDASQAMLTSGVGDDSDYVIFSPRKFVGVPDGGVLRCVSGRSLGDLVLQRPPAEWWLQAFRASVERYLYDTHGGDRSIWFDLYKRAEANVPCDSFAMSDLTQALLYDWIDFEQVSAARRSNYLLLAEHLERLALLPPLPSNVVPLGFPIRAGDRDRLRAALIADEIFAPIHWELGNAVPTTYAYSHQLANEILTLPCDQRYDHADMLRIVERVARHEGTGLTGV
jgi:dTDP-4-amino-4,6-dideoxygalactose transaminase